MTMTYVRKSKVPRYFTCPFCKEISLEVGGEVYLDNHLRKVCITCARSGIIPSGDPDVKVRYRITEHSRAVEQG